MLSLCITLNQEAVPWLAIREKEQRTFCFEGFAAGADKNSIYSFLTQYGEYTGRKRPISMDATLI